MPSKGLDVTCRVCNRVVSKPTDMLVDGGTAYHVHFRCHAILAMLAYRRISGAVEYQRATPDLCKVETPCSERDQYACFDGRKLLSDTIPRPALKRPPRGTTGAGQAV